MEEKKKDTLNKLYNSIVLIRPDIDRKACGLELFLHPDKIYKTLSFVDSKPYDLIILLMVGTINIS